MNWATIAKGVAKGLALLFVLLAQGVWIRQLDTKVAILRSEVGFLEARIELRDNQQD